MRKRITVPTPSVFLVWKSTPPAEMSAVSAKYSCASAVRTVIGSLSGKRTELLVSAGPRPATGVLTSFTPAPLPARSHPHRGHPNIPLLFPAHQRTCAVRDGQTSGQH